MTTENYVYKKEVDWSLLQEGLTLPFDNQVIFGQVMGRFLNRGESKDITLYLNGKSYKAQIRNVNFDPKFKRKKDTLQIRYSKNGELAKALQTYFSKSYQFIKTTREMREPGDRTMIRLPEECKEYLAIYTTEYDTQNEKIEQVTDSTMVVGVDIGSQIHYARAFDNRGRELTKRIFSFHNDLEGFNSFNLWAETLKTENKKTAVLIGCEPTGHYWFAFAKYVNDHQKRLVMVNPFSVKKIKELDDNSPKKTDSKDPKTIAKLVVDGRYSISYMPEGANSARTVRLF